MSPRQQMLAQVRRSASTVISKLRHVETIEKRPFRLGRVVGGFNSEQSQFTFQNLLTTFNHRLLHHVDIVEPPAGFPVGRVIDSRRQGNRVKRMSSFIDTQLSVSSNSSNASSPQGIPAPPPPFRPPPPRRKLHLSLAAAIEHFNPLKLQHVEPVVKLTLPDATTIARERALSVEDDETTPTTAASASKREDHRLHLMEKYATVWLKKTRAEASRIHRLQLMEKYATVWLRKTRAALQLAEASHMRAVHQAAHSEIERFDRSWLQHVEPVVKQTLPDGRTLVQERARYKAAMSAAARQVAQSEGRGLQSEGRGLQGTEPGEVEPADPTLPAGSQSSQSPVLPRQQSSPSGLEELDVMDLLQAGQEQGPNLQYNLSEVEWDGKTGYPGQKCTIS